MTAVIKPIAYTWCAILVAYCSVQALGFLLGYAPMPDIFVQIVKYTNFIYWYFTQTFLTSVITVCAITLISIFTAAAIKYLVSNQ